MATQGVDPATRKPVVYPAYLRALTGIRYTAYILPNLLVGLAFVLVIDRRFIDEVVSPAFWGNIGLTAFGVAVFFVTWSVFAAVGQLTMDGDTATFVTARRTVAVARDRFSRVRFSRFFGTAVVYYRDLKGRRRPAMLSQQQGQALEAWLKKGPVS